MLKDINQKREQKEVRRKRVRAKISGTAQRPRLNVYRSLKHIYLQIIDDQSGKTLVAANELELKSKTGNKTERAKEVGKLIAQKAKEKGIESVIFERASYKYHGRVKAAAEGAREGGLKF